MLSVARSAVLANATAAQVGGFIRANVRPGTKIVSDGFTGYARLDGYNHDPILQGTGANAGVNVPIVHKLFSNVKVWLNGTHQHLSRYRREWSYRFNRRWSIDTLDTFLLRRAVSRTTITYRELVAGRMAQGAA